MATEGSYIAVAFSYVSCDAAHIGAHDVRGTQCKQESPEPTAVLLREGTNSSIFTASSSGSMTAINVAGVWQN